MGWNQNPIAVSTLANARLAAAPIPAAWVLAGTPNARAATLSKSPDNLAVTVVWDCTAGIFRWRFGDDETVHILEGGVTVHWNGEQHDLGVGDVAFFPAGTVATWIIKERVRKLAFIRVPPPLPLSLAQRIWSRLARSMSRAETADAAGLAPRSS